VGMACEGGQASAAGWLALGAHPGFFSRNIDGRCTFKYVEVQMKRRTHVRND